MKKIKITIISTLVLGVIISVSSCSNNDNIMLIDKLENENSALEIELDSLKNEQEQLEHNKKLVIDFLQEVFGDQNPDAIHKFIGDNYIQHDPEITDGKEALIAALKNWFYGVEPHKIDIRNITAERDLVFIHLKAHKGNKEISIVDIFRIENNMLVEHWDVVQEVPENSINPHPMF